MRRLSPVLFVLSVLFWLQGDAKAHSPSYCADWSSNEDGFHRLFARWTYLLHDNQYQALGAKVRIVREPLTAEYVNSSTNHVDHVLWMYTDSGSSSIDFVEVGIRELYDDSPVLPQAVHRESFYYGRAANINGEDGRYDWWWVNDLSLPAYDSHVRYTIRWNSGRDGYDIYIQRTSADDVHYIATAHYNNLRLWKLKAGSESNYCDANDGDSNYNYVAPALTYDWYWIRNDNTNHIITVPDPPESDLPAHMDIIDPDRQSACFHMSTTAMC